MNDSFMTRWYSAPVLWFVLVAVLLATWAVMDPGALVNAFDQDGKLRTLLKEMHADYHPDVVRVIARVGRAMGEDKFVTSKGGGNDVRALEDRMWPNMHV